MSARPLPIASQPVLPAQSGYGFSDWAARAACIERGEWETFLRDHCIDCHDAWEALAEMGPKLSAARLAGIFRQLWFASDYTGCDRSPIITLLTRLRSCDPRIRRKLFFPEDWDAFKELLSVLTIYRGCSQRNRAGMNWSLSEDVAQGFAGSVEQVAKISGKPVEGFVIKRRIRRSEALFYTDQRDEAEMVSPWFAGGVRL
jgi:hypothetical protein